jgi:2,4-dienoyl-CoA reductase-like NADH-dependent reductase (Old Yellow Enzyme family)
LSNRRDDQYGGSFENRTRLLLEVVAAVKTAWPPDNPLFVRISATDWTDAGWRPDDALKLAGLLKQSGVDLVDCSGGGNVAHAKIPTGPGFQVPFSEAIRKTGVLTGAVGIITSAVQAETILQEEGADLIFMAREMLRNPYFGLKAAGELGSDIAWPVQYTRARPAVQRPI